MFMCLKGGCQEDGSSLFSVVPSNRKRDNGQKLIHRKFHQNLRKSVFTVWVTKHCNRFPTEFVEYPSPEIFKNYLDTMLYNVL